MKNKQYSGFHFIDGMQLHRFAKLLVGGRIKRNILMTTGMDALILRKDDY
jgi:hypothetical protein